MEQTRRSTGPVIAALVISLVAVFAFIDPAAGQLRTATDPPKPAEESGVEVWKGVISVMGTKLEFVLRITRDSASEVSATLDIPAQGAKGIALENITRSDKKLAFTLSGPSPAVFDLNVSEDGKKAEGTMKQVGQDFPVSAERITEAESSEVGPHRPQTPKPPFPYKEESVAFKNEKHNVTLGGTLTLPKRKGPHPAVVLISGSGLQDRDETLFGHKPFLVIADHLTRKGIAVLRCDDRGIGDSKADIDLVKNSTTADLAEDTRAALRYLRTRKDIDPKRLGLIGHSEGGIIAPMIAADDNDVACIVLLAGSSVPGRNVLSGQLEKIMLASGVSRDNVDRQLKAQARYFDLVEADATEAEMKAALRELVSAQLEAAGTPAEESQMSAMMEAAMKSHSPWMTYFIKHDPRESLRRVRCPVLALNGALDTQVLPDDNLPEIEKALNEAGNEDVTIKRLRHLNHLFQKAVTGAPSEYATIEETFDTQALETLSKWLVKRLKVKKQTATRSADIKENKE